MKKVRFLVAALCVALGLGALCFAVACKPETPENPTATLTLSAGEGGTLAQTAYEVEIGASLSEFLKDVMPTPETGLTFAGWYHDGTLLGNEKMPESGYALTARYNASYTVELYLEGTDGVYGEAETSTGSSLYGQPFTYAPSQAHFVLDESKENKLSSEKLGKGETFTVYLKRETYSVFYYLNAPAEDGFSGNPAPSSMRYGTNFSLPDEDGMTSPAWYRFAGWAKEADGELAYKAGDEVSLEADLFLYAVWDEAYYDRYGGGDFLFFPSTEPETAVLVRAEKEYSGEKQSGSSAGETLFSFKNEDGKEILKGKANNLTREFIYYREAQEGVKYRHADAYHDILHEDGATIEFDGYGSVTFTEGETVKKGEVSYDPETMYYTFRSGETGFRFMLTELTDGDSSEAVYNTIGAEAGLYEYLSFYYQNGQIKEYGDLYPYFDGMGRVAVFDEYLEAYYVGSYLPEEGNVVSLSLIYLADGETVELNVKLYTYEGSGIMVSEDGSEGTYTSKSDGTLFLDGFSGTNESAVWTDAQGTERKGMYAFDLTARGGTLLRFREESGEITTFLIQNGRFTKVGDDSYAEYFIYYGNAASSALGGDVLLFGENGAATLLIDGETEIAGAVTEVDGMPDLYLFTSTDRTEVFQYRLGAGFFTFSGYEYYCHYFLYYPVFEEGSQDMSVLPTEDGGTLLIDYNSSVGVYTKGNVSSVGYLFVLDERMGLTDRVFLEFLNIATSEYTFYEVVEKDGSASLVPLGDGTGYYFLFNGSTVDEDSYLLLLFDGKKPENNIAFYVDPEGTRHLGQFTYNNQTFRGVFTADSEGVTLRFATVQLTGGDMCYVLHNELWTEEEKTFRGSDGHTLILDGYGLAEYDGREMNYYIVGPLEKENSYRIYAYAQAAEGFYEALFDIDLKNGTYTACGYEAGQYNADDDSGDALMLDGYGNVTRYNIHFLEDDGTPIPRETGKYIFVDEDEEILRVTFGEKSYLIQIWALYDGEDYTNYYTVEFAGAGTYVSEDWEYLSLGAYGEAVFTDRYGISYEGAYTRLSEHAVSFESETLDGVQIFILSETTFTHPTSGMAVDGDVLVKYLGGSEKAVTVPEGVKKIAPLAFSEHEYGSRYRGADITSIVLTDVEEIGENAFNGCASLVSVTGENVQTVGANAFYACIGLSALDLPALEVIGENAFHLCESLASVKLEKAKTIYSSAFSGCSELVKVELPAAEKLYEGVFYDCFALETVVLGANLTQLGTPDEAVAGVFGRSFGEAQRPLTVCLRGSSVPTAGLDLFEGVETYTVVVPDIDTVKKFYLNDGWAEYNPNLGCASEYDGTYYRYQYGVTAIVLNGVLRGTDSSMTVKGAYYVEGNIFHLLTFDPSAETKYTDKEKGVFTEDGVFLYDGYGYGLEEEYYEYFFRCYKAGEELTLTLSDTEGDTIAFTPEAYTSLAAGTVYTVSAVWTKGGEKKNVTVSLEIDQYYDCSLYMLADGDRYSMSPIVTAEKQSVSLGSPVFNPIVSVYFAEDESYLALSQNNREGTEYTASVVLAEIKDEDGTPFSQAQVPVEKGEDEKTFTAKQSYVFAGYSYKFTFKITGEETFTYSYVRERQIVVDAENGSARVILYQNAEGAITSVTLYVDSYGYGSWTDVVAYTQNYELTKEDGKFYHWLVYEYNYAGDFTLTLTGEGESLTGTLACGTVVKGDLDSVYVVAFYTGDARTSLYMRGTDGEYGKVEDSAITENGDYLTVTFKGNKYYVTIDLTEKTVSIVFADRTYQSDDYTDVEGSVRLVRNPNGSIQSMTLTIGEKSYTTFTEYPDEYNPYYVITDGETYYYVTMGSSNCRISLLTKKEVAGDNNKLKLTLLIGTDTKLKHVDGATYDGKPVTVNFFPFSDYDVDKECAWLEVITEEGAKYFYRANVTDGTVTASVGATLTTEDKNYRVTIIFEDNNPVEALRLEVKQGDEYLELSVTWSTTVDDTDQYNYEIDTDIGNFYFIIAKEGDVWKLTFVNSYIW